MRHSRQALPFARSPLLCAAVALAVLFASGCGRNADQRPGKRAAADPPRRTSAASSESSRPAAADTPREERPGKRAGSSEPAVPPPDDEPPRLDDPAAPEEDERSLADLLPDKPEGPPGRDRPVRPIDEDKLAAHGIRKITGKHLVLYTDVPPGEEVDRLPAVFDLAVPEWCRYFGLDAEEYTFWRIAGYLMKDKAKFLATGLLSPDMPPFLNGYASLNELWLYEQPESAYYRRHLLLHEGVHALMFNAFGEAGPPWYLEGMAELLATHRLADGKLTLPYFPESTDEVPNLGRIRIVQDACAAHRALHLGQVLQFGPRAHLKNEAYGWSWAAAALLDGHPRYRERFRRLPQVLAKADFQEEFEHEFEKLFAHDFDKLSQEWQLYVAGLEHGYDFEQAAIDFRPGEPLPADGGAAELRADRGWQSSGIRLEAGRRYRLRATGRYQIAENDGAAWPCEPNGVTIRYHDGRPLGMLLASVQPERVSPRDLTPFLNPTVVGLETTLEPQNTGTLYLRVNDSDAELDDNAGTLRVEIAPL